MNPYTLIGGVVIGFAAIAGTFLYGVNVGEDRAEATQAAIDRTVAATREAATQGAATAIAKNRPVNVTRRQETIKEIYENTRYSDAGCAVTDGVFDRINSSLTGRTGAVPSIVPPASAPIR